MNEEINKFPWYSEEAGFFSEWYFGIVGIRSKDEKAPKECDFLEEVLKLREGAKILDLCCGHGRLTNEMAYRGYEMTGQDINGHFLELAEKDAAEKNLNISWVKSDMRKIPFEDKFDAVLNMFTSFAYFGSDEEDEKVIKAVNKSLKSGGKFVLDYVNKDFIIRNYMSEDRREIDNGYVLIKREYDFLKSSHADNYYIYINDKLAKQFKGEFRFYSVPELVSILTRNGFKIINVFGDFDFEPLSFESKGCIIIAEKI